MLNLLLPGAQGAVCSRRYYLNRCAALQDSKKMMKRHCQHFELALSPALRRKREMFQFFSPRLQGINLKMSLAGHFVTRPPRARFNSTLVCVLSEGKMCGKPRGNWSQAKE